MSSSVCIWLNDNSIDAGISESQLAMFSSMVIDPTAAGADVAEFVRHRVAAQQEHMQTIWREFDDSVRAIVPLFETEVRGLPMLQRLCDVMFGADKTTGAPGASVDRPQEVGVSP